MKENDNIPVWDFGPRCPGCTYELEYKIAIPPILAVRGLTYSDIEKMEDNILVCPSGCGYYKDVGEYPLNPLILNVIEPEPEPELKVIQLPLPIEFFDELPQPLLLHRYTRRKSKVLVAAPFLSSHTQVYSHFFLAELSAQNREKKG